jgi:carbon monoxide dehydrogenase subunit G
MELTGERRLAASRSDTWAALNDPEVLKASIPGCESIERAGDNEYALTVLAALGPVRAKFAGKLFVEDVVPPESYTLRFEGQGGAAGFAKGSSKVMLFDDGGATLLRYTATAQVGGRIAQVGSRLIDSAALRLADDFFANFEKRLLPMHRKPTTAAFHGRDRRRHVARHRLCPRPGRRGSGHRDHRALPAVRRAMNLVPGALGLADLAAFARSHEKVTLDAASLKRLDAGAEAVRRIVAQGQPVYGINTGFGKLAQTHIADDQLELLQRNLVLSHSVGVGALLDDDVVRLVLLLKIASLARGYSGVRREVVNALVALLDAEVYPCIPSKGSVGASGDLAPLAHMSATLLGWGEVRHTARGCPPSRD